jgi:hypothetical protein
MLSHMSGNATNQELPCDSTDARRQYATRTVGSNNQATTKNGARGNSTLMSPTIAASTPTINSNAEIPKARTYPHQRHLKIPHAQSALTKARARNRKLASSIRGLTPSERLIGTGAVNNGPNTLNGHRTREQCHDPMSQVDNSVTHICALTWLLRTTGAVRQSPPSRSHPLRSRAENPWDSVLHLGRLRSPTAS